MDTLISIGTLAAWAWSIVALFFLGAGELDMRMEFALDLGAGAGGGEIYFEVATVVVTLILMGRYFEARAKRRAGAALKALLELGAKDVAVLGPDGKSAAWPSRSCASAISSSSGRARRSPRTASSRRASRRSTRRC